MDYNLMEALDLLEREKGVPAETILDALANALVSAYKRQPGAAEEARVTIDPDTGEIVVYGQELDEDGNVTREWEDTPGDFGRIAAQTAKQVIVQRLRDAKREQVFDLYQGREGDLVTGIVQQSDHRSVMLDLGNTEAVMPGSERIPYERLDRGARVKAYIVEVREETKGPQIVVSRSHPDFIRSLFELEVPEITEGVVEIRQIAREAGHRTKIAVLSNDPNVDPVGACVGARGSRVRQVVNELRGEKVDIVEWRDDAPSFIAEALSPAKVKEVRIEPPPDDAEEGAPHTAVVIVPDHQLSLAIGKEGQNARLAARLSGYRVDIRSESEELGIVPEVEEAASSQGEEVEQASSDADETAEEVEQASSDADEASSAAEEASEAAEESAAGAEVEGAAAEGASPAAVETEEAESSPEAAEEVEEASVEDDAPSPEAAEDVEEPSDEDSSDDDDEDESE